MYKSMKIEDIETPALVIDLDSLDSNIDRMSSYFKSINCSLRPHFKTHKCPVVAAKQIRAGAIGITCAKVGEAEVLVKAGIDNILLANQVVQASKIMRLAGMARYCNIMVAVDSPANVDDLSAAASAASSGIGVLIEVDVGMGRCGVRDVESALSLAGKVARAPGLILKGVMGYEGHCVFIEDPESRKSKTHEANAILVGFKDYLQANGFNMEIVSGGGTGTYRFSSTFRGMTEIQAGSYVFMDARYSRIEGGEFENSLYLLASVVSKPCKGVAVIDSGMKCITQEFGIPQIVYPEGMKLLRLAEEHGIVETYGGGEWLKPGDKVRVMPSHCCTTVNLHDKYYVVSKGSVVGEWDISGRGKFA